jgi:hypothetical protein
VTSNGTTVIEDSPLGLHLTGPEGDLASNLTFVAAADSVVDETYLDGAAPDSIDVEARIVDSAGSLSLSVPTNGGFSVRLTPLAGHDRAP